jgi:hypothetical protein
VDSLRHVNRNTVEGREFGVIRRHGFLFPDGDLTVVRACQQDIYFFTGWRYDQVAAFGFDDNLCRRPQEIINRVTDGKRDSAAVSDGLYNRRPSMVAQPKVTKFNSDGRFLIIAELPVLVTGGHQGFGWIAPFEGDTAATLVKHQRAGCGILVTMFGDPSTRRVPPDRILGWRHRQQTRNEDWNYQTANED